MKQSTKSDCIQPSNGDGTTPSQGGHAIPVIPHASTNERLIVGKLVTDLLAAGCLLSVNDGEEVTVKDSTDAAMIFAALSSTGEDYLIVRHDGLLFGGPGWVRLIWGNDVDVISDYVIRLEDLLAGANALAEELTR